MSPSRPKRPAKKAAPKKAVARKPKKAAVRKSAAARPAPSKKAAKPTKATPAAKAKPKGAPAWEHPERSHCVATDPFGDPCQSAPRLPSKYCTIHSYLDR